jgi:hypothetical protein
MSADLIAGLATSIGLFFKRFFMSARKSRIYGSAFRRGKLPARKLGRRTIILAADLEKWLSELPSTRARKDGSHATG